MKKLLMIMTIAVAPAIYQNVWAQQPAPVQVPQTFALKDLSLAEIETIGKALGKLPYEEVAVLFGKLRSQMVEQQTPKKPEPEKK
jgi:hypothetical protein